MVLFLWISKPSHSKDFTNHTFLIAEGTSENLNGSDYWKYLGSNNYSGIKLQLKEANGKIYVSNSRLELDFVLHKIIGLTDTFSTKVFPVFLHYDGNVRLLDSIINLSPVSSKIFYLPQGETWPTLEYLVQAKRGVLFFISGKYSGKSNIMHETDQNVFHVSAREISGSELTKIPSSGSNTELFMVTEFNELPIKMPSGQMGRNMIPEYINFLLENWMKFGKRPNFLFVGDNFSTFNFIISQLNSFTWINGTVRASGKIIERVYWKSPDILVTGRKFSFPYRGGEEKILSPFVPGYVLSPSQIIVTGEMEIPENYSISANPLNLSDGIKGSFNFEGNVINLVEPTVVYIGENYSFSQDIERGSVLKLPEKSSINLGDPGKFGMRNSSFTVSCFVKFTEIMEYGDNAVLGNYESEYRRGLHLILRSGHPYFGLYGNDYISEEKLKINIWYHLTWRYIIETGEQAIFLNGRNVGRSVGHPPFSGRGEIHLGSALSRGASLRGYIDDLNFWDRPLGSEEISRLALGEEISAVNDESKLKPLVKKLIFLTGILILLICAGLLYFLFFRKRIREKISNEILLPKKDRENQLIMFGEFKVTDNKGVDITELFTPKVKELFLFVVVNSVKNGKGADTSDINENLWPGISPQKVANNRAVTLNKLRKILEKVKGFEILSMNSYLYSKMDSSFFCDFYEAYKLCHKTGGLSKYQLEIFFQLVKSGRLLKGLVWPWLDEIRGYTGNQVIDNLLKLATYYRVDGKYDEISAISRRILDYDDLNEEAIYLQIWTLQKANNLHQAKFVFNSFCSRYFEIMTISYPKNFESFIEEYSELL